MWYETQDTQYAKLVRVDAVYGGEMRCFDYSTYSLVSVAPTSDMTGRQL